MSLTTFIENTSTALRRLAGIGVAYLPNYGAVSGGNASAAFATANAALSGANGGTIRVPDGVWLITEPIVLRQNVSLRLSSGATIRATSGFSGSCLIRTSLDAEDRNNWGRTHWLDGLITGGRLDCNNIVADGVELNAVVNFKIRDCIVENPASRGLVLGGDTMTSFPYELIVDRVHVVRDWLRFSATRSDGTIGIAFNKCSDSKVLSATVTGFDTGVSFVAGGGNNECHNTKIWSHPCSARFLKGFDINQRGVLVNQCDIDTPFDSLDCTAIDPATDSITLAAHPFVTGDLVYLRSIAAIGSAPAGLANSTYYWVNVVDPNTIRLATSNANAIAGTVVDIQANTPPFRLVHGKTTYSGLFINPNISEIRICKTQVYCNSIYGIDNAIEGIFVSFGVSRLYLEGNYFKGESSTARLRRDFGGDVTARNLATVVGNVSMNVVTEALPVAAVQTRGSSGQRVYSPQGTGYIDTFVSDDGVGNCIVGQRLISADAATQQYRYFRDTPANSPASISIFRGDNTNNLQHSLGANINTALGIQAAHKVAIGSQTPQANGHKLQVTGSLYVGVSPPAVDPGTGFVTATTVQLSATNTQAIVTQSDAGAGGDSQLDFNLTPQTSGNGATLRFFRTTNSTTFAALQVCRGNNTNTVNAQIAGRGESWVCSLGGTFGVGQQPNSSGALLQPTSLFVGTAAATNPGTGNIQAAGWIKPVSDTVANLAALTSVPFGAISVATNGRKQGQSAGNGTGVPVWFDGTIWRTFYDNSQVQA
jgi:hypothetical protein